MMLARKQRAPSSSVTALVFYPPLLHPPHPHGLPNFITIIRVSASSEQLAGQLIPELRLLEFTPTTWTDALGEVSSGVIVTGGVQRGRELKGRRPFESGGGG